MPLTDSLKVVDPIAEIVGLVVVDPIVEIVEAMKGDLLAVVLMKEDLVLDSK